MSDLSDHDIERIVYGVAEKMKGHSSHADVAAAAAHKVVQEMTVKGLAFVGINAADAAQLEMLKADLGFVRSLRLFSERTSRQVTSTITQAVIWGIMGLIVVGFLFWSRSGAPGHPSLPSPMRGIK